MASDDLDRAAALIASAQTLLFTAGAGMGVDSGLPDFRGDEGFWKAYPPFRHLGLSFVDLANPRWFRQDPELAWGFYGHRLGLYRKTVPHAGFATLRRWAETRAHFVFTLNVDGQFQKAGFAPERILECHGSIHTATCVSGCGALIRAADFEVVVDEVTFRAQPPLPRCPSCGGLARPNILMFGDSGWDGSDCDVQEQRFASFLESAVAPIVVVECGAGSAVPTVRQLGEQLVRRMNAKLVRINLREPEVPAGQVGLALGAKVALAEIDRRIAAG